MKLPFRAEIEDLAASLPRPRVIYDGSGKSPYLSRYYLHGRPTMPDGSEPFNAFGDPLPDAVWDKTFGIYLHRFHRGDEDRELHNHPFAWSFSVILVGGYLEERRVFDEFARPERMWNVEKREVRPGQINFIGKNDFHRVDLIDGECWTLFVAGPKIGTWGFWERETDKAFPWREFIERKRGLVVSSSSGRSST